MRMKIFKSMKKGALALLQEAVIAFAVVGIVLAVAFSILGQIQTTQVTGAAGCNSTSVANCGFGYNGTVQALNGTNILAQWLPTIAIVIAAAVVLIIVFAYIAGRGKHGGM